MTAKRQQTADGRFLPGSQVVWRSLHRSTRGFSAAMNVIDDQDDHIVLHQPPGATTMDRTGPAAGPHGRNMVPGGWDGGYRPRPPRVNSTVRVHVVAEGYSVFRRWDAVREVFTSWYVNLELPWRRTPIGFDSADLTLDVKPADDLRSWEWQDADELDWLHRAEAVDSEFVDYAYRQGRRAISDLERRAWPFSADWSRWEPDPSWPVPELPVNWAEDFGGGDGNGGDGNGEGRRG